MFIYYLKIIHELLRGLELDWDEVIDVWNFDRDEYINRGDPPIGILNGFTRFIYMKFNGGYKEIELQDLMEMVVDDINDKYDAIWYQKDLYNGYNQDEIIIPFNKFKSEYFQEKKNKSIKETNEDYVKLQRGQKGVVDDGWDFNIADGQHGRGVYSFLYGDTKMKEYYTKNGEKLHTFKIPRKYMIDLSYKKWDIWDAKSFIYNNPQYKAFIFRHHGIGIPSSKEVLITDPSIIEILI